VPPSVTLEPPSKNLLSYRLPSKMYVWDGHAGCKLKLRFWSRPYDPSPQRRAFVRFRRRDCVGNTGFCTSRRKSGISSSMGSPVFLSMSSILMLAPHRALSMSCTRYFRSKLTTQRRLGLCWHKEHWGSRHPKALQRKFVISDLAREEIIMSWPKLPYMQSWRKTSCRSRCSKGIMS
jgi:hypothetical protein